MSAHGHATGSSLTDMMASLVAIFALLFVAANNNRGAGIQTAREALIKQLRGDLMVAGIDSASIRADPSDPNSVLILLPERVLFNRGESEMLPEGRRIVRQATPPLARLLCTASREWDLEEVVVEGHTDSTIRFGTDPSEGRRFNLELSQKRALNFVMQSMDTLTLESGPVDCFLKLVSATGRGQEKPRPDLPPDADEQRRVVLRFRLAASQVDSVKAELGASNP
jgi:outer membrane protein OmpA-like peptidoglycan-associated protein